MVDPFKTEPLHGRSAAVVAISLLMCSCSTINVPVDPPEFKPDEMLCASGAGVEMGVKPIQGRDSYWSLFDDNLPEAGIAALWVSVRNVADGEIDFSKVKWVLRRGGTDQLALDGDHVFKLYYRARHVRMYGVETDRQARLAMERIRFQPGRIRPSMVREGFLFFRVVPSSALDWTGLGTLFADNIRLRDGRMSSLQVHLAHANP
jgi:hypothetical protein